MGDKLAAIAKAVANLSANGLFLANLDLASVRHADGRSAARTVSARLRASGMTYDRRRRLVCCSGPRLLDWRMRYLGADDTAGPNYTDQPAVASYYEFARFSS